MAIELKTFPDASAASTFAAEEIAAAGRQAVEERDEFSLALSGGHTPWQMIGRLGDLEGMPWDQTRIFQVDERIAAPGDEDRNLTHMVLGLSMGHQPALRPMPVTSRDLELAATFYEDQLPSRLDLVHLGLGPDGHTASLVPGDTALEASRHRVAITGRAYEGHRRMTLTLPALAQARRILWLTLGEKAREPLARLLAGDTSIPAGLVENENMLVVADEAAAGDAGHGAVRRPQSAE